MGRRLRVLLVEDNEADREMVKRLLITTFEITVARSLAEMIAVTRGTPDPDVVLLDLRLPDSEDPLRDPLSTVRLVVRKYPNSAVIITTGIGGDEQLALNALNLGAQDYLVKEMYVREQMIMKIRFAYSRKQAETRRLTEASSASLPITFDQDKLIAKLEEKLEKRFKLKSDVYDAVAAGDITKFTIGQVGFFMKKNWTFLTGAVGMIGIAWAAMRGAHDLAQETAVAAKSNAESIQALAVNAKKSRQGFNDDIERIENEAKERSDKLERAIVKSQVLQVKAAEHLEKMITASNPRARKVKPPPELTKAREEVEKLEVEERLFDEDEGNVRP